MQPDDSLFPNCTTPGCPGHVAGYNWADANGITDPADCQGKSDAFIEGCQIYCQQLTDTTSTTPTS